MDPTSTTPVRDARPDDSAAARSPVPPPLLGRGSRWAWWPYLAVVLATLLANWRYVFGDRLFEPLATRAGVGSVVPSGQAGTYTLDPNDGFTREALGVAAARALSRGELPWWNPFEGLGQPLLGEMQGAGLFPLTPLLLLPAGMLVADLLLQAVAGCTTVALLRGWGVPAWIAAIGGVLFALNGTLAWIHNAVFVPVAFVPMLLWGVERSWRAARDGRRSGWVVTALALALSLTAGFPETAYLGGLLAGVLVLARLITGGAPRWAYLRRLAAGAVAGLALAAPALVSFLDLLRQSDIGAHADYAMVSLPEHSWAQLFTPYAYGGIQEYWGTATDNSLITVWSGVGGYATAALLALAAIGALGAVATGHLRGIRIGLLAWVVVTLAKSYAVPGVTEVVNLLPAIDVALFGRYAYPTWILALVLLAALGLDDAVRRRTPAWTVLAGPLVVGVVLATGWSDGRPVVEANSDPALASTYAASYGWAVGSVLAVSAAWVLLRLRTVLVARVAAVLAAGVLCAEAVVFFARPSAAAPVGFTEDPALAAFLDERAADPLSARVYTLTGVLLPNYGSYFGVPQLNVNDAPVPQAWTDFVDDTLVPTAATPGLSGGLYAYSPTVAEDLLRQLADHPDAYRDAAVGWVITNADVPARPEFAELLRPVVSEPGYVISELVGARPWLDAPGCAIAATSRTSATLDCPAPTEVVRRELAMPGWTAQVDGTDIGLTTVDGVFQAVSVPAGRHTVTFSFTPPLGGLSVWLAGAAGLALLAGAVWPRIRPVPRTSERPALGRRRPGRVRDEVPDAARPAG